MVVTEGATVVDVERRLTAKPCAAGADVRHGVRARADRGRGRPRRWRTSRRSGLPTDFTVGGKAPSLGRGLPVPGDLPLRPQHRRRAARCSRWSASSPTTPGRRNFTAQAKALGLTPYQELIIASIAQAEAKYPAGHAQGRAGHPQPHQGRPEPADRRHQRLRRQAQGPGPDQDHLLAGPGPVQHLQPRRPAADADRQPGHRRHAGRRAPGRPATGCTTSTATPPGTCSSPTARRRSPGPRPSARPAAGAAGSRDGGPAGRGRRSAAGRSAPLAVAGAAPRGLRRAAGSTGATTRSTAASDELPGVLAERADWAGFSCTMPLKHAALRGRRRGAPAGRGGRLGEHARSRAATAGSPTTPTSPGSSPPCASADAAPTAVTVLGAGGTAQAVLAALAELGVGRVHVARARRRPGPRPLLATAERVGVAGRAWRRSSPDASALGADAGGVDAAGAARPTRSPAPRGAPSRPCWTSPTTRGRPRWPRPPAAAGATVVSGALMLLHQAAEQVRAHDRPRRRRSRRCAPHCGWWRPAPASDASCRSGAPYGALWSRIRRPDSGEGAGRASGVVDLLVPGEGAAQVSAGAHLGDHRGWTCSGGSGGGAAAEKGGTTGCRSRGASCRDQVASSARARPVGDLGGVLMSPCLEPAAPLIGAAAGRASPARCAAGGQLAGSAPGGGVRGGLAGAGGAALRGCPSPRRCLACVSGGAFARASALWPLCASFVRARLERSRGCLWCAVARCWAIRATAQHKRARRPRSVSASRRRSCRGRGRGPCSRRRGRCCG